MDPSILASIIGGLFALACAWFTHYLTKRSGGQAEPGQPPPGSDAAGGEAAEWIGRGRSLSQSGSRRLAVRIGAGVLVAVLLIPLAVVLVKYRQDEPSLTYWFEQGGNLEDAVHVMPGGFDFKPAEARTQGAGTIGGGLLGQVEDGHPVGTLAYDMSLESVERRAGQEGSLELKLDLLGGQRLVFATYMREGGVIGQTALCAAATDLRSCVYEDDFPIAWNAESAPVHVRAELEDRSVAVFLDGDVRVQAPTDSGPIVRWEFFMNAGPGSVFHLNVDNLHVAPADGGG